MAPGTRGNGEPQTDQEQFISTRELLRRLAISRSTIYRHNLFQYAVRVGSQWRFNWASVLRHYEKPAETAGDTVTTGGTPEGADGR